MEKRKRILLFFILILYQNTFSQVTQQWISMYNGPADGFDQANLIAYDNSGNVYVTGFSQFSPGTNDYDYITIKYNSSGIQQWTARYSGPGNHEDRAVSIAIDGSGNVYVTGFSRGTGIADDYATIKYDSSGVQQWVQRYSGPVDSADQANSLAVDNSGNVYVTGYSRGSLTGFDIATIKYNTNGDSMWVQRFNASGNNYDAGKSVVVDDSGNVYVTGFSKGFTTYNDFVTIKYNSSGIVKWVRSYNGTSANDVAISIAVDGSGNVYVTGNSDGNGTDADYATLKYNPEGVQQWVKRYDGLEHGNDLPTSLVVDISGNVYVTGMSIAFGTGYDYATIKYSSSGIQKWLARYDGPGNSGDIAYSIAVDDSYNVYVSGKSGASNYYNDCTTIKYDSAGTEKWIQRYVKTFSNNVGKSIKVDDLGNVFVTGYTDGNGTRTDYLTLKYSQLIVGINQISNNIPKGFMLEQNYPNPFNPNTVISYQLAVSSFAKLKVYDILGNEITTLVNEKQNAGSYSVEFDASIYPSGIYYYKLEAGDFSEVRKMIMVK